MAIDGHFAYAVIIHLIAYNCSTAAAAIDVAGADTNNLTLAVCLTFCQSQRFANDAATDFDQGILLNNTIVATAVHGVDDVGVARDIDLGAFDIAKMDYTVGDILHIGCLT